MSEHSCRGCGVAVAAHRTFCRLSCRIAFDGRNRRLPLVEMTFDSELPAAPTRCDACRMRPATVDDQSRPGRLCFVCARRHAAEVNVP